MRNKAIIALIVANVIWGAASPIFKWSLSNIPPFTLALLRFNIAAIILGSFVHKGLDQIKRIDRTKVILFGLSGVTFNISFFFFGLQLAPSINASLIATIQPVLLLILGALLLREKVEKHEIFGTLISLAGVLMIVLYPLLTNGFQGESTFLGNLFFILATLGAVGQAYLGKQLFKKYAPLPITFASFTIGALTFFPFFLWEWWQNPNWLGELAMPGLVGILYGAIFSSLLAYSLFDWGLSKIEASETGIFTYLMPITAIVIAVPFFGEEINLPFVIGAILVISGIILTEGHFPYSLLHKHSQT